MMTRKKLYILEIIRAIAALLVFLGHLRTLVFKDFEFLESKNSIIKCFYFITGFGHQSVVVFFVLSGFVIANSSLERLIIGDLSIKDYFINRLSRLWIVLIPVLLITMACDLGGRYLYADNYIYMDTISTLSIGGMEKLTLHTFLGNLFFIQTLFCDTYGSNTPLWSLANEWWYYSLFPLCLTAFSDWRKREYKAASLKIILIACIIYMIGAPMLIGFGIWSLGVIVFLFYKYSSKMSSYKVGFTISGLLLVAFLSLLRINYLSFSDQAEDFILGVIVSIFMYFALYMNSHIPNWLGKTGDFMGKISYSLYVVHMPISIFLTAFLNPSNNRLEFEKGAISIYLGIMFFVITLAYIIHYIFERHLHILKRGITSVL